MLGLLWVALASASGWTQQQYYVSEHDGRSPSTAASDADLPGVDLSSPYESTDVGWTTPARYDAQPERRGGHRADDYDDGADDRPVREPRRASTAADPADEPSGRRPTVDAANAQRFLQFVHRRRARGAELFLLILALAVGIGAYAAVGLGVDGEVPTNIVGVRRLAGRARDRRPLVVRLAAPYADPVLLPSSPRSTASAWR